MHRPHPPDLEHELARRPEVVSFSVISLVVRCPRCKTSYTYRLSAERPVADDYCRACLVPWKWR